jgi:hypothetical protein
MEFPPSSPAPTASLRSRLKRAGRLALLVLVWLAQTNRVSAANPLSREESDFFEKEIRPLLEERCLECHSQKSGKTKGGLSLASREGLLRGGESGPAAVPGDPEKSRIIIAVRRHDTDLQMPPKNPLTAPQVATLTEWVRRGLPDPRSQTASKESPSIKTAGMTMEEGRAFWSFKPVVRPVPPEVRRKDWVQTPVDTFILARLEQENLPPAGRADKRTLLRRVTFDLTGLPPTLQEVEAFEADPSPDAFAKVVERLLQSPAYGERWGRHWLDVVRYADTCGNASDYPVPQAHLYRNWVLDAVGADMPFDRFLREQIAGDLLPSEDRDTQYKRVIATGYLAMARRFAGKAGAKHLTIEDTIDNLSRAVLGVSLACARCHNHKFDPFTVEDYYGLYGIFESTRYPYPGAEGDTKQSLFIPLMNGAEIDAILSPHKQELSRAEAELKPLEARQNELRKLPENDPARISGLAELAPLLTAAKKNVADLNARAPVVRDAYAVTDADARANAKIQIRGEPKNLGATVPRKFPEILGGMQLAPDAKGSGRLELAQWLTSESNPLTARVMVNRIWLHHFGRGLVETPNDFGRQGKAPSHPELLDYLASEFMQSGWSLKTMHRLILLSHSWQLSAGSPPEAELKDPSNTLLSHASRRRLDAESIRDSLLFVSGELASRPEQEHPFPPRHTWSWTQHKPFAESYPSQSRSVYLMQSRLRKNAYLTLFDGADPSSSTGVRSHTITPLQALFSLNDPVLHKCAEGLASRYILPAADDPARVRAAYARALAREPSRGELERAVSFVSQYREALATTQTAPRGTAGPESDVWNAFARSLLATNEFLYLD